jgi:prepilin-type N-terminal cleavage/methylation domain-containing protein
VNGKINRRLCWRGGFSYIEILVALAIFAVALAAVLPVLSQAGRNLAFAREAYDAHQRARHMMLVVRDALDSGLPAAEAAAIAFAAERGGFPFTVWFVKGTEVVHMVHSSGDLIFPVVPPVYANNFNAFPDRTAVVVVVYNEYGHVAGRAVGVG